jgi:hypothetical protein
MTIIQTYSIGAAFSIVLSLIAILVLRPHLTRLLEELCGNSQRAAFWGIVSGLFIFLTGVLAGTVTYGYGNLSALATEQSLFFGLITQIRACLFGLLFAVLMVAWVLLGFIRRFEHGLLPPPPEPQGRPVSPTFVPQ